MNQLKNLLNKIKSFFLWWWENLILRTIRWFSTRYTIQVSYDQQWGNADDQEFKHVRKIIKSNFKELKFRTEDYREIHIRGMNGLRYKIEEE